jgi:hypothetical protein
VSPAQKTAFTRDLVKPAWQVTLLAFALLQLSGSTVGPNYHTPSTQIPSAYKEAAGWKPAQPNDQNLGGDWWTLFQDPQLNDLELQVNVSNQNLKAAERRRHEPPYTTLALTCTRRSQPAVSLLASFCFP